MELVAKKQGIGIYLFYLIFGLFFIVFGIAMTVISIMVGAPAILPAVAVFGAMGIAFTVIGAVFVGLINATPQNVIVREGDTLKFPGGEVKLYDLTNVYYRASLARWSWWTPPVGGTMILTTGMQEIKVRYVGQPEAVQRRISQLIIESKNGMLATKVEDNG